MDTGTAVRILLVGRRSRWVEGVRDLLLLAGYQVVLAPSWTEAEHLPDGEAARLVIVDLTGAERDVSFPAGSIPGSLASVPVLFVSFSDDARLQRLRRSLSRNGDHGRLCFYSHRLLGAQGLLDQVRSCLATDPASRLEPAGSNGPIRSQAS